MTTMLARTCGRGFFLPVFVGGLFALGCQTTPIDVTPGPAPLRTPRPDPTAKCYEDSLTGGQVFTMYCSQCHNARALAERPFANYENAVAHMRVRANLTGVEYEKLLAFMRRWHDIPPPEPTSPTEPSPKRLIYGQPITELREQPAAAAAPGAPGAPPAPAGAAPAAAPAPAAAAPAAAAAEAAGIPMPAALPPSAALPR